MRTIYHFLLLFSCLTAFSQGRDSATYQNPYFKKINAQFVSRSSLYEGIIRDFNTLPKGQISAEVNLAPNLILQANTGLHDNIELNAGIITADEDFSLSPFLGLTMKHPVTKKLYLGLDFQMAYLSKSKIIAPNISYGVQYQTKKLNIGSSVFIQLGKNKVYDNIMVNSVNLWALYRVKRRANLAIMYLHGGNPTFYSNPESWPRYIGRGGNIYYELLFKRSKLALGLQFRSYDPILYYNGFDLIPFLKYNFLIRK